MPSATPASVAHGAGKRHPGAGGPGTVPGGRRGEASELLPLFGLEGFASSYPAALSGGMRQRAALLRTFLLHKDILLLDEPFGALDAITRNALQEWLLEVWQRFRQTILSSPTT